MHIPVFRKSVLCAGELEFKVIIIIIIITTNHPEYSSPRAKVIRYRPKNQRYNTAALQAARSDMADLPVKLHTANLL